MEKEVLIKAQSYVQDLVDYLNNKSKSTLYGVIANINSFMFDGKNGINIIFLNMMAKLNVQVLLNIKQIIQTLKFIQLNQHITIRLLKHIIF